MAGAFQQLRQSAQAGGYSNLAREVVVDDGLHPEYQGTNIYGLQRIVAKDGTEHLLGTISKAAQIINFSTGQVAYDFSAFGPGPRAGGDSYNAVAHWKGRYYFGGWVICPCPPGTSLNTLDKYTYLISTDQPDDPTSWQIHISEKSASATGWKAEISDLIPTEDYLYICRADEQGGQGGTGLYRMDEAGVVSPVDTTTLAFRGAVIGNKLYWVKRAFETLSTLDLTTGATGTLSLANVPSPRWDSTATSSYDFTWQSKPYSVGGRIHVPGLNGYYVTNRDSGYRHFIPVLPSVTSGTKRALGWRNQPCMVDGGVVVAANVTDDSTQENEAKSYLLWIGPNSDVRVIDVGGYFSGCAVFGDRLYYGVSASAHLGPFSNYLIGGVSLASIPLSEVKGRAVPFRETINSPAAVAGKWGGFPTLGYSRAKMVLKSSAAADLRIWHYSGHEELVEVGKVTFTAGQTQVIDLTPYLTGGLLRFDTSVASTVSGSVSFG